MNCVIPFEKKVKFDYPVNEICSISLEHEITKNDDELLGNFFISGTCKEHELSVNETDFKFTIPFSVEYTERIDIDTLSFSIDNFTYELLDNELKVNIDYEINADDLKEDPIELIDESYREPEIIEEPIYEEIREEEINPKVVQEDILNMAMEDDYANYHVHFIKNDETIDSICLMYKIDKEELLSFNNIDTIEGIGNILIPLKDE